MTERITKKDALALAIIHSVGNVTPQQVIALHPEIKPHIAIDMVRRAEKTVRVMVDRRVVLAPALAPVPAAADTTPTAE